MNAATLRRHGPALGIAIAAGLIVRLIWVAYVHPDPLDGRFDDTVWYRNGAHFIALGDGYLNSFTGTPTAAWPPGYPAFLGAVYAAFGEGVAQTIGANVFLQLATIPLVYAIALIAFERRTAAVAAFTISLWPGQVFFASLTLSEPLFTFLFTLAVLLVLLVPRAGRWRNAMVAAFAVVLAAAAVTRGQALVLLPVAAIAWVMSGYTWRESLAWCGLATAALALCLAPWAMRNQRVLDSPVLISTNIGANLWIGNHEGASGRMQIDEKEPPQPEAPAECAGLTGGAWQVCRRGGRTQGEYEAAADRLALREGLGYIFSHPRREIELAATKVRAMYEADSTALDWNKGYSTEDYIISRDAEDVLRDLANGLWFAMLILAGVGVIASRSALNGPPGTLLVILLAWTATHMLFFGDSRFHYPTVFVVALFGARGLVVLFEALRRPQPALDSRYATA